MPMVDDLICSVARAGRLSPEQAAQAVTGMLQFLAARLPSPLFGELRARLDGDGEPAVLPARPAPPAGEA